MKHLCLVCTLAILLAVAGASQGGLVRPYDQTHNIVPLSSRDVALEFKGGERAFAKVQGDGKSYLGLYVYDVHGNCVAWDDRGMSLQPGNLEVEWFPTGPKDAVYVIEVRNTGLENNECKVAIR